MAGSVNSKSVNPDSETLCTCNDATSSLYVISEEEEITNESLLDAVYDLYENKESYITALSSSKHKNSIEQIVQLFEKAVK